ncbi:MAG: hypothetical protein MJK04_24190 [Psychrosphaera sp.]|nr:hypothetical protein [Psychrosphaera sp.]
MKFRYLLRILILCLPTLAWAQDPNLLDDSSALPHKNIQTTIDHQGVQRLHQRFTAHYGRFIERQRSPTEIFDFIMDKKSSDISFDLIYLLNVAVGEGESIDHFSDFGIELDNNGKFVINYQTNPHLMSPATLFLYVKIVSSANFMSHFLIPAGFRSEDMTTLIQYVKTHDVYEDVINTAKDYEEKHVLAWLNRMINQKDSMDTQTYQHHLALLSYNHKFLDHNIHTQWAHALMAEFDEKRQNILKLVLHEILKNRQNVTPHELGFRPRAKLVSDYEAAIQRYNEHQASQQ